MWPHMVWLARACGSHFSYRGAATCLGQDGHLCRLCHMYLYGASVSLVPHVVGANSWPAVPPCARSAPMGQWPASGVPLQHWVFPCNLPPPLFFLQPPDGEPSAAVVTKGFGAWNGHGIASCRHWWELALPLAALVLKICGP